MTNKKRPFNLLDDRFTKAFAHNNPELIKKLISLILDLNAKEITIQYLSTELGLSRINEYLKTVDFNILINDNIIVNIEVNRRRFKYVKYRNYIYLAKILNNVLKIGNDPNTLKKYKVYQININGHDKETSNKKREVMNFYSDNKEIFLDNIKIIELNLEKYKNLLYTEDATKEDIILGSLKSKSIEEFNNNLKRCVSDELREEIIRSVKREMKDVKIVFTDEETRGLDALNMYGYEEEIQEDLKEERELGKKEGLEQGIERGKNQSKLEIAKNLLLQKIPIDVIKKATGLSMKTIKSIVL